MSEQEYVRVAGGQPVGDRVQRAGQQQAVAVEEEQVASARGGRTGVAGRAGAEVCGKGDHPDPGVAPGELGGDRRAAVPGSVVHDEEFRLAGNLVEHGLDGRPEIPLIAVGGHDNTEKHGSRA